MQKSAHLGRFLHGTASKLRRSPRLAARFTPQQAADSSGGSIVKQIHPPCKPAVPSAESPDPFWECALLQTTVQRPPDPAKTADKNKKRPSRALSASIGFSRAFAFSARLLNSYEAIADRANGTSCTKPRARATTRTPCGDSSIARVREHSPHNQ
jgi:hypothetical protein